MYYLVQIPESENASVRSVSDLEELKALVSAVVSKYDASGEQIQLLIFQGEQLMISKPGRVVEVYQVTNDPEVAGQVLTPLFSCCTPLTVSDGVLG